MTEAGQSYTSKPSSLTIRPLFSAQERVALTIYVRSFRDGKWVQEGGPQHLYWEHDRQMTVQRVTKLFS